MSFTPAPQPGERAPGWGNLLIHNGHLTSARFDGQGAHSPWAGGCLLARG